MTRPRHGDYAWLAIIFGVLFFDILDDDRLSIAAGRYMKIHPWLWRGLVFVTALHVTETLPVRLDPYRIPKRILPGIWPLRSHSFRRAVP